MASTDESGEATDRPGTRKTNDRTRTAPELEEKVDHPKHYQHASGVEAIVICEHMNFNLGNAVKYILRAGQKTPDPTEDLRKAAWYLARELDRLATGDAKSLAEKKVAEALRELDRRTEGPMAKGKPFQACWRLFTSRCKRPLGHDGRHESNGLAWDDS